MYNLVKKICLTNGVMCDMSKFAEFHRDRDPMYNLVKKICLINAVKCDMSKFAEFHRDPDLGGDISGGKKARSKIIFSNLTKVRALNKIVVFTSLQHYSL